MLFKQVKAKLCDPLKIEKFAKLETLHYRRFTVNLIVYRLIVNMNTLSRCKQAIVMYISSGGEIDMLWQQVIAIDITY